jgi:hypothetical protein
LFAKTLKNRLAETEETQDEIYAGIIKEDAVYYEELILEWL